MILFFITIPNIHHSFMSLKRDSAIILYRYTLQQEYHLLPKCVLAVADLYSAVKPSQRRGGEGYLFGGVMSLVMGLMTVVRLTKNMPRKLTEAAIYGGEVDKAETTMVSNQEYMSMVKRMAELEEKCRSLDNQPAAFSPEKEQILTAALSRVDELELQLAQTKKVQS